MAVGARGKFALVAAAAWLAGAAIGAGPCDFPAHGPDVIVAELYEIFHWTDGPSGGPVNGRHAYSIGTISCNVGDMPADWFLSTARHPVIAQSLFRLKDGRFEQIGQAWVKHGYVASTGNTCCQCTGGNGTRLMPGCSDPYNAGLNAGNGNDSFTFRLGPKHAVNASDGTFPWPLTPLTRSNQIEYRLQTAEEDVDSALNPGARWFVEAHYVHPDEDPYNNGANETNNASHREVAFGPGHSPAFPAGSTTRRTLPAIYAWAEADPAVTIRVVDVPDDGRFTLACKATDNGDGTWSYEYAVHNLNSDRSGASFSVPCSSLVEVGAIGFHDCDWHSGAPYTNIDWPGSQNSGAVSWATEPFAQNVNANALRWSTLYNFRFVADRPPAPATVTLGLFKPGTPAAITFDAIGPSNPCPADITGDGLVNAADLAVMLGAWGSTGGVADLDGGAVGSSDLAILLGAWGACP